MPAQKNADPHCIGETPNYLAFCCDARILLLRRRLPAHWAGAPTQSMGAWPCDSSQALASEKCPQPMKGRGGRRAESGEGWLAISSLHAVPLASMAAALLWAWLPHNRKTRSEEHTSELQSR